MTEKKKKNRFNNWLKTESYKDEFSERKEKLIERKEKKRNEKPV